MRISAVLPAYNEGLNIGRSVDSIIKYFNSHKNIVEWEVIVVNDGSIDDTPKIVEEILDKEPRVKLVNNLVNKGYGKTLYNGIGNASHEWVFITDSDLQFYIDDLDKLIPFVNRYSFLQGIRSNRKDPYSRILLGKIYKFIIHVIFNPPVSDPECSFKLFKRKLIEDTDAICSGPMVPLELVLNAKNNNAIFYEADVRHRERRFGETNALTLKSFLKIIRDFFNLIIRTYLK